MKRVYISGLEPNIVSELRSFLDIRVWLHQSPDCTHDIGQITALNFPEKESVASDFDYACYAYVYEDLPRFLDIFTRSFPYYEKTYHGLLNSFNRLFGYCYHLIVSNRIEYVVFGNIPHEGVDFVVSKIAEYLKIPTLMFHQSLFPSRFWVMRKLSDFGDFSDMPVLSSNEGYRLKTEFSWFYMDGRNYQYRLKNLLRDIYRHPGSLPYALYKYKKAFDFRKMLGGMISNVDLNQDYVYFPLHLQPELTTSALGGMYSDQAFALERLSAILPKDWLIYVKENPKQTDLQRDRDFFLRIKALKNVVIVPMEMDSMALIRSSKFVATITGTAGWEAISVGKKVLYFGLPWYGKLPSTFKFTPSFTINDIIFSGDIEVKDLESAVVELLNKAAVGVIDPAYSILVQDFDAQRNALQVSAMIRSLIFPKI